jgi:hypothetical protein
MRKITLDRRLNRFQYRFECCEEETISVTAKNQITGYPVPILK